MFYNKLRKNATINYENALTAFQESNERLATEKISFYTAQDDSVKLIEEFCGILNTVSNTPIEIKSEINSALEITARTEKISFSLSGYLEEASRNQMIFQNLLSNTLMNNEISTTAKLFSVGAYTISYGFLTVKKNKEIAEKLQAETKVIYSRIEVDKLRATSVEARRIEIDTMLNKLKEGKERLKSFNNVNYLSIDSDDRKYLGSVVNNLMVLSNLISGKSLIGSECDG